MMEKFLYKELSYKLIGLAMEVHRELGSGFLEKVYENALMILLEKNNLKAVQQFPIKIEYQEKIIGDYIADIIVEDKIILELKSVSKIIGVHKAQLGNYLKATGKEVGLILNFGSKSLEVERIIFQRSVQSEKSATEKEILEIKKINDDKERERYERREKANKDRVSALEKAENDGVEKGIEQGEKKKAIEIAKNLLKMGLSIDQVVEASKLSVEEIKRIIE